MWITPPSFPLPPNPLSEEEDPTDVRVFVTSLIPAPAAPYYVGQPSLELPFNSVSFTLTINQAGAFSVEFQVEQVEVRYDNWHNWTTPGKSFVWVMVNKKLVYGGRIMNREVTKTTQKCVLTGNDFYSYWAQQMQFRDYTSFLQTYTTSGGQTKQFLWAGNYGLGAPAPLIAITLMRDKGAADYFLPLLHTPHNGLAAGSSTDPDTWINAIPSANWIEFSAPISQMQTVDTLVQQMVQLGYPIGCDVFVLPSFDDASGSNTGTPHAPYVNQYVAWPRAGMTAAQQGESIPVLDLNAALEVKWTEDATSQTTNMWEQIGQNSAIWDGPFPNTFAMETHHWPLMEQAFSHSYINPVYLRDELLAQIQQGDKNIYSFPQLAPVITVPCFWPSAFDLLGIKQLMAYDVQVANLHNPDDPAQVAPGLPFPPPGWTDTMRLIQADVTIPDKGVATMDLTLNMPPNRTNPPIYQNNPSF